MSCKNLTGKNPFHLVYVQEAMIPMEDIIPILSIDAIIEMTDVGIVEERLSQLI